MCNVWQAAGCHCASTQDLTPIRQAHLKWSHSRWPWPTSSRYVYSCLQTDYYSSLSKMLDLGWYYSIIACHSIQNIKDKGLYEPTNTIPKHPGPQYTSVKHCSVFTSATLTLVLSQVGGRWYCDPAWWSCHAAYHHAYHHVEQLLDIWTFGQGESVSSQSWLQL